MDVHKAGKYLSAKDPAMEKLILQTGPVVLPPPKGDFETLVEAVISQQLSTKAAATIHGRLVRLSANEVVPERITDLSVSELRGAGVSGQKAGYLHALAEAFAKDADRYSRLHEMDDAEVIESLTEIKGIGVWTAQMFLIFTLLREDVFPIGDLGIRRGMERFIFSPDEAPTKAQMTERAETWKPFRSVASLYLWKGTD